MADISASKVGFVAGCPDCGRRDFRLPDPLPEVGDDFDWLQRDYDSFRLAMLEELAARFPERGDRWKPADLEVVLVETVSVVLDQLSDLLDRVHAEAFLETARRPESVRRLLGMIGYDPLADSDIAYDPGDPESVSAATAELDRSWIMRPDLMAQAKEAGPRAIHRQRRMVTVDDYAEQLEGHPLVMRAKATCVWTGSWTTLRVAVVLAENVELGGDVKAVFDGDDADELNSNLRDLIDEFHRDHDLDLVNWNSDHTNRSVLQEFISAYRMVGQEVWLQDADFVPIEIGLSVRVRSNQYRSEVRRAVEEALGMGVGGFFEPGNLEFGEDLHASDLIEATMVLDGVEAICLNRFKRLGVRYPDQADRGQISLEGTEIAICDGNPFDPSRGVLRLRIHGGQVG